MGVQSNNLVSGKTEHFSSADATPSPRAIGREAGRRALRVLVAGGRSEGIGEAIATALSRLRGIESAEPLSEAAEAQVWARFGTVDLLVVFPDSAPIPKDFGSELQSCGCKAIGAFLAGDTEGKKLLDQVGITEQVEIGDDLDIAARRLIYVLRRCRGDFDSVEGDQSGQTAEVAGGRSIRVFVAVASLGVPAGSTMLSLALGEVLRRRGFETVLADFDFHAASLSSWLLTASGGKRRSGELISLPKSGYFNGHRWELGPIGRNWWLMHYGAISRLEEPDPSLLTGALSEALARFPAVVVDSGTVLGRPGDPARSNPKAAVFRAVARSSTIEPCSWVMVCRADPPGLRAFLDVWSSISGDWNRDSGVRSKFVVVLNDVPPKLGSRRFNQLRKSVARVTGCDVVLGLPHEPMLRATFWEAAFGEDLVSFSAYFEGVGHLADELGCDASPGGLVFHRSVSRLNVIEKLFGRRRDA